MGTIRHARGTITFDPPLTAAELRGEQFAPYLAKDNSAETTQHDVMLEVEQREEETDDGTLIRRFAAKIVPAWPDGKNYEFQKELADLVALLTENTQRTFSGAIVLMVEGKTVDADFGARRVTVAVAGLDNSNPTVFTSPLEFFWGDREPYVPWN